MIAMTALRATCSPKVGPTLCAVEAVAPAASPNSLLERVLTGPADLVGRDLALDLEDVLARALGFSTLLDLGASALGDVGVGSAVRTVVDARRLARGSP